MSLLQQLKLSIMGVSDLSKDALHIYVGLLVLFGTAMLLRRPLRKGWPLAAVLMVALAGEIWGAADTLRTGAMVQPSANWHDIWNTMFWPVVITLLARFTPVFTRR